MKKWLSLKQQVRLEEEGLSEPPLLDEARTLDEYLFLLRGKRGGGQGEETSQDFVIALLKRGCD